MLSVETAFWIFLAAAVSTAAVVGWRFGKLQALGVGMATSLLSASWFEISFGAFPLGVPAATAAIGLIAFCIHSGSRFWSPLTALDLSVVAIVLWHLVVDVRLGGDPVLTAVRAYGEWGLPYAAGRFALMHRDSLTQLSPWFAGAAAVLAAVAVFESFTSINLWETIAPRDDRVAFRRSLRYGIAYRANGTTRHAIFLGVVLLTMIPWAVAMIDNVQRSRDQKLGRSSLLLLTIVGVFATVSRGPIMAVPLIGLLVACWISKWTRIVTAGLAVAAVLIVSSFPEQTLSILETNPDEKALATVVVLDEDSEAMVQSATRNRLLVVQIYGPLVIKGGLFGYGSVASYGFPPENIPGMPTDPAVLSQIGIVDNTFIGMGLRFGIVGSVLLVLCFMIAASTAFFSAADASTFFYPHTGLTSAAFGAAVIAVGLELTTVYFDQDHAFWVMFLFGAISGLQISTKAAPDY